MSPVINQDRSIKSLILIHLQPGKLQWIQNLGGELRLWPLMRLLNRTSKEMVTQLFGEVSSTGICDVWVEGGTQIRQNGDAITCIGYMLRYSRFGQYQSDEQIN